MRPISDNSGPSPKATRPANAGTGAVGAGETAPHAWQQIGQEGPARAGDVGGAVRESGVANAPGIVPDAASTDLPQIVIDPEFEHLISPPKKDELATLERELQAERVCRDPLVVWKGHNTLLDGHSRHTLCQKHGIPFQVHEMDFPDREEARAWMMRNQLGRRNLREENVSYLRGKLYESRKRKGQRTDLTSAQNVQKSGTTAAALAEEFHVDEKTIRRDERYARDLDAVAQIKDRGEAIRQKVLAGDLKLTRAEIAKLVGLSPAEQKRVAKVILAEGKWDKPKPGPTQADALAALRKAWERAGAEDRRAFLGEVLAKSDVVAVVRDLLGKAAGEVA
jgi:hypothetical protein